MTRTEHTEHGELSLVELQQTLQLDIDPGLLLLALTHRSFAYENGGIPTNERLEFLGDSILGQAVTVKLFRDHPELEEGELAKRRASLVSSAALAEVGRSIGVGPYIRLGRGETMTGGADKPSILAGPRSPGSRLPKTAVRMPNPRPTSREKRDSHGCSEAEEVTRPNPPAPRAVEGRAPHARQDR